MADSAALLVNAVLPHQPMRQWVLSVPFPLRFLFASQPVVMGRVLGIVYLAIATHLRRKAGYTKATAQTGAVTLIQRFGSAGKAKIAVCRRQEAVLVCRYARAVNLNIHFHMLFLDGVYIRDSGKSATRFARVKAPTSDELTQLSHTIAKRIAVGPQQGRKVLTLQTLPDCGSDDPCARTAGHVAGFSLHAGVAAKAHERDKLERLCRYVARPAVSTRRLSLTRNGQVRYELKTPYNDGTTHVIFEPLDFIARLVALVPRPRVNLTRYHGIFAPHSRHRALVTPARACSKRSESGDNQTPAERRASMTWAQRLKRVFNIDIKTCSKCGGDVRIIATIEDPVVINKILAHLDAIAHLARGGRLPPCRAPPSAGLIEAS